MRPTLQLKELISSHMSVPGHVSSATDETNFVMSALRAANSASILNRRRILSDICDVLDCNLEELDFLFSEFSKPVSSAANYEVMVPDFQTRLLAVAE